MSVEFDAGSGQRKLPVYRGTSGVALGHTGCYISREFFERGDALVQALAGDGREFEFNHVEPGSIFGRVVHLVHFEAGGQSSGLSSGQVLVEDGVGVGVEVVLDQRDFLGSRVGGGQGAAQSGSSPRPCGGPRPRPGAGPCPVRRPPAGRPCPSAHTCCFPVEAAPRWRAAPLGRAGPARAAAAQRAGRGAHRAARRSRPSESAGRRPARRRPVRPPGGPERRRSPPLGTSAAGGGAAARFFEHLTHGFIRNSFHQAQPHGFVGQQAQGPAAVPGWGRRAGQGRKRGAVRPVKAPRSAAARSLG